MRRVDCFIGADKDTLKKAPHIRVYCESKNDSLLIKDSHERGNGGINKCKVFKLHSVDKKILRCEVYLYKKEELITKVYVEHTYECFSVRSNWLIKKDRRVKFSYLDVVDSKLNTYTFRCIQDYTRVY